MTKHRRTTGLVAIVLLAVASAAAMRSQSPSTTLSIASTDSKELTVGVSKLSAGDAGDRSPVYSTKR